MNICLSRVRGVASRHLYTLFRNWDRLTDMMYWPIIDMVVWGLMTQWLQQSPQHGMNVVAVTLTAIVFWQVLWRANQEISLGLLEEIWTQNLSTLFATPLTLAEWILGVLSVGFVKLAVSMTVGLGGAWLLFKLNILSVGVLLLPFLVNLTLFGWTIGFTVSALIVRFGRKIQTLAWSVPGLFAPLSAVYFPVSTMPGWAQPIVYAVPSTYVFEGMRAVMSTGEIRMDFLALSFGLNLLYLLGALWLFASMFEKKRELGLARLG